MRHQVVGPNIVTMRRGVSTVLTGRVALVTLQTAAPRAAVQPILLGIPAFRPDTGQVRRGATSATYAVVQHFQTVPPGFAWLDMENRFK
jgi:hypothetical protein